MNEKMVKKKYEPMMLRRIEFETEDILTGSIGNGYFGDWDDGWRNKNTVSIFSDNGTETQNRANIT